MDKKEKLIIIYSLILTFLFNELFIFGGFGISVFIYFVIYYAMMFVYCKKNDIKIVLKNNLLIIPITLCSFCFVLFDNNFLKFLNLIFLWFTVTMNTACIMKNNNENKSLLKSVIDVLQISVVYPVENIGICFGIIKNRIKGNSKIKLITFLKVGIGLLIGLILLIIIVPLLMKSDAAFYGMVILILKSLSFNFLFSIFKRIIVFFIIFFPIYSYIYGFTHETVNNKNTVSAANKEFIFDYVIVITSISVISLIYLLFCISQFSYFISAFSGILPKDYSYSQYARRGFFEAIPLSIINFMIITLLNKLLSQSKTVIRKIVSKVYSLFICSVSLFIVATAVSKLILYMKAYGLTILRIYSAWFLILLLMILVLLYIKSIYEKINTSKSIFNIFIIMFLLLNYVNVDYLIGKYNSLLYADNKIGTIDTFEDLSLSASEPLCTLNIRENDQNVGKYTVRQYNHIKEKYKRKVIRKNKWQQWNFAKHNAEKVLFKD